MINKIKQFFKQKHSQKAWQLLINQDRRNFLLVFGLFIIITAAFFAVYKINNKAQAAWWNDTWQYRKAITVGSGSSAASNYQILINNYDTATDIAAGKMQSDCSDLRFTSLEGVELSYWIESGCNSSTTDIWVKVDEIPASGGTSIYMYYGNPTAGSASNEDNTFIFADDFEQNDISKWNASVSDATNSVQQRTTTQKKSGSYGAESYQTGTDDGDTLLKHTFSERSVIIEAEFYDTATLTSNETIIFGSLDFYAGVATSTSTTHYSYRCGGSWAATTLARSTGWHRIKAVYTGVTAEIYIDGTSYATCSSLPTANTMQYGSAWLVTSAGFYADNLIMREYLATEPTTSVGSEEQGTSPIAYYSFDEGYGTTVHNQMEKNGEHGLVSWWKFDDSTSGTSPAPQDSMGINNGTWGGGATYTNTAKLGNAANFTSSGYISLGDPVSLQPTNLSVSVWFKTSSIGDMRLVRKRTYGYILGMGASDLGASSGQVTFNIFDSASNQYKVTSTSTYNDGSWHHAVGTFDGNNVKLYIDGQLIGTVTAAVNIYYESDEITIGRDGGVSSRYFTGQMDELKIYNRALTEQEIIAQYNSIHGHMINMDPSTDWVEGAKQNPQQRALGKALDFDGSNDYVTVGNSITGVQSISLWIKPTNTTQSILDLDGGTHYLTLSSGSITANGFSSPSYYVNGVSGQTVTANVWNHVVITTATSFTGSAINIGKVSSNYFSGQIDEVKIYRKVLTVEQIKKEYNRGAGAVMGAATHAGTGAAPKGFWKFDEDSGFSAFDSSGNNNTGILTNMDTTSDWVTGKVGKALDFDGTNDYIATSLTSINPASSAFTASAWVKFNSTSAQQTIIQQRDGSGTGRNLIAFDSSTCGNNKFYSFLGGSCTSTNSTYIDNVWYHVTVTWDLTTLKIYINGNLENSGTPTAESANGEIIIGIGKDLSSSPMNGLIDHVKIYDYVRTPEQIHYDMATGSPIAHFSFDEGYGTTVHNSQEKNGENGLVSWWKFDTASSGTISTAYDEKEVNNGTGYNATYSSTAKIGNSGYFYTGDSTNDYITVTDNDSLDLTTITISAWVRPTDVSGYGTILGKRDSASATTAYALRSNNTQLDFYWKNSGNWQVYTTSDANLVINTWYHIAATYDGTSVKIYKDGVLLTGSCTTGTCNNALEITNDNLGIGWSGEMGSEFWDGYLDSVKLYNRVLSAAEIAADYNSVHGHMINMDPATDWVEGAKQNLQQRVLSKALDFDGSNDRVQIPYSSKLNFSGRAAFSVSAWINPKINNAYGSIVSQSDGSTNTYVMAMNSSGRIEAGRITAATGSTVIPTNKWSHVVFTYDGTYINVYVNAAVDATPTSDINNAGSSDDLLIGAHNYTSPSVFFNGSIDEVKIYNYALTANEVKTEYNRGAAVVLGAGKNEADTAASSLVGWWKMDEGSGFSAFDSSGNNNTGVLTNMDASSDWVAGKVGKALDFDGSNDYISVANSSSINITGSQITVSAWVNFRTANSHDYILEKGQNGGNAQYYFWYAYQWGSCPGGTNNCLISGYYDGSTYRNYMYNWTPLTNRWYHLAWAADGSNVRIYIDGVMISEQTQTGSLQSIAYPLFFGSSRYLINHMDGKIDHVKLFNRALTGAEVAWEYNQGAPIYHWDFNDGQGVIATNAQGKSVPTDGLVGFWTMDSTTVNDMSGNGNHLTNSGSPTSVTGIKGNAVDYASASSQYSYCTDANCGPDLDYQGNGLTLSAWVKADSVVPTSGYRVIMMKHYYTSSTDNGGYYLVAGDGGNPVSQTLRCVLRNSVGSSTQVEVNSGVDMSTSYWQHVVCTYDNNTARIYIDGVLKSSTSYTGGIKNVSNDFYLGRATAGNYWDGQIDHVKIWQRALSATEVAIEYSYDEKYGYLTNMDAASDWVNGALPATNRPMLGKALDFDGSNDYLIAEIPKCWSSGTGIGTTGITYSAWIKTANSSTVSTVAAIGKGGGCNYACLTGLQTNIDGAGTISMVVYSGSAYYYATSNNSVADNQWHHVVGVYRTNHYMDLYVDGILQESVNVGSIYSRYTYGFIGIAANIDDNPGPVQYFSGQMDEIKIYNYALSANQVKLDYNNSAAVRY